QDWAKNQGPDSFNAYSITGAANVLTWQDLIAMDVLGYNLATLPTFTWTNATGTASWTSAANWSPASGPPTLFSSTAIFAAASPVGTVTLDGGQMVGVLQFNNGTSNTGMIINPGTL